MPITSLVARGAHRHPISVDSSIVLVVPNLHQGNTVNITTFAETIRPERRGGFRLFAGEPEHPPSGRRLNEELIAMTSILYIIPAVLMSTALSRPTCVALGRTDDLN